MRLVRQFYWKDETNNLTNWCKINKDLYNQALYLEYQYWKNEGKIYSYPQLDKIMKKEKNTEGKINYRLLPKAQISQQTLKLVEKNFKSFFKLIKMWKNNKKSLTGKPNPPKYLPKDGMYFLTIPNQSCRIKNKEIKITKTYSIKIPDGVWIDDLENFKQVRIHPTKIKNIFKIEIVYEKDCENKDLNYNEYASIDLGVNNLITLVDTLGNKPLIINGKPLKSKNQWYNKQIAKLQSIKDKMKIKRRSKRMNEITEKRNRQIDDYLHKASRLIVNYLLHFKIGNLIVGQNKNWKKEINIGKKNNQNFVQIPYERLIRMLEYKCKLVGIKFKLVEESYTSKCDALALEEIGKHKKYLGKRIKRGLFQSSVGKILNADVNGALNILRKVVHNSFIKRIVDRGFLFNPVKIRSLFETNSLQTFLLKPCNEF